MDRPRAYPKLWKHHAAYDALYRHDAELHGDFADGAATHGLRWLRAVAA